VHVTATSVVRMLKGLCVCMLLVYVQKTQPVIAFVAAPFWSWPSANAGNVAQNRSNCSSGIGIGLHTHMGRVMLRTVSACSTLRDIC
jgi:hypothetical protein